MDKSKIGYFIGYILIILAIVSFLVVYFDPRAYSDGLGSPWGGFCPQCVYLNNPFFYSGLFCSLLAVVGIGYSMHKRNLNKIKMDKMLKATLIFFGISMILLILFFALPWRMQFLGVKVVILIFMIIFFIITIYILLQKLRIAEVLDSLTIKSD
jgi:uncharacterized membrane protein